jgi:flagellin
MSIVVNTNIGSLNAQRSLAESSRELSTAMERLSSGKKINSAADDAAGFAIAERMTAQIRGLNMATKNANDGLAMLSTVENATNDVTDMLQRVRELAVQASNDTNSTTDRQYLQKEVDSLLNEINRVASQTVYNDKVALDGTLTGQLQVGTGNGQNIAFSIKAIDTDTLGLTGSSAVAAVETATLAGLTGTNDQTLDVTFDGVTVQLGTWKTNTGTAGAGDANNLNITGNSAANLVTGIEQNTNYASFNFTVAASGTNVVFTAKTAGAVTGQMSISKDDGTASTAAVTTSTAGANAGATSTAFTAGSTPSVIATTASDNIVTSTGSAQTPSAGTDSVLGLSVLTAKDAEAALTKISAALEQVAGSRAESGAMANRLEYTVSNLMNVAEFTTSARSRIEDADFAAESARLAKAQVLQQTGTAMLAQANAASQPLTP